jgi:chromosome partitioning protein
VRILDWAGTSWARTLGVVTRNDHQDALSAGLAVGEYAPGSKSADEIRGLWQWVEARLSGGAAADEQPIVRELAATSVIAATEFLETSAETAALVSWSGL